MKVLQIFGWFLSKDIFTIVEIKMGENIFSSNQKSDNLNRFLVKFAS